MENNNLASAILSQLEGANLKYKKMFKWALYITLPLIFIISAVGFFFVKTRGKTIVESNDASNDTDTTNDVDIEIKIKAVEVFHKTDETNTSRWHSYKELKESIDKW